MDAKAPTGELRVLSCWVLSGLKGERILSSLADAQTEGDHQKAGADTGFLGKWVCGSRRFKSLRRELECAPAVNSGHTYRFGSGSGQTVSTWECLVQVGELERRIEIDVLNGSLPLLAGDEALEAMGLVVDCGARQLLQRSGSRLQVLSGYAKGEMPSFELKPGRCEHVEKKTFASFAAGVEKVEAKAEADEATELGSVESGSAESNSDDEWGEWGGEDEEKGGSEPVKQEDEYQEVTRKKAGHPKSKKVGASDTREKPTLNSFEALASDVAGGSTCAERSVEVPVLAGKKGMKWPESKKGKKQRGKVPERKAKAADERAQKVAKPVDVPEPEVPEKGTEPEQAKSKKPKVLGTTNKELQKLHRARHAQVDAMLEFLLSTCSKSEKEEWAAELAQLGERVKWVVGQCRGCQLGERNMKPGRVLPREPVKEYQQRCWMDMICLDYSKGYWGLGVVDEATDDCGFAFCPDKKAETVAHAYFERWASLRGWTRLAVSDQAKELLGGAKFLDVVESQGTSGRCSAAENPWAHGRIERKFEVVRWALDRECAEDKKPKSEREWKVFLYTLENAVRNTVMAGGFSSSQRAWGRATTLLRSALDDTPATATALKGAEGELKRMLELQETAREVFLKAVNSRKLREMLAEKTREEPRIRQRGEEVWFRHKGKWAGPGIVRGYEEVSQVYEVVRGSITYRPGKYDVKGVEEPKVLSSPNPRKAPDVLQEAAIRVTGSQTKVDESPQGTKKAQELDARAREDEEKKRVEPETDADVLAEDRRRELLAKSKRYQKLADGTWVNDEEGRGPDEDELRAMGVSTPVKRRSIGNANAQQFEMSPASLKQTPQQKAEVRGREDGEEAAESSEEDAKRRKRRRRKLQKRAGEQSGLACFATNVYQPGVDVPAERKGEQVVCQSDGVWVGGEKLVEHDKWGVSCLVGIKGGSDVYGMKWEDVPEVKQAASRQQGVDDLTEFGCWDVDEAVKVWELRQGGAMVFPAHWVDKPKVVDGLLEGRSRWTPHGYVERDVEKSEVESPTASFAAHVVIEVLGASKRWGTFRFDVSSAFFKSEETSKEAYIQLPPEEIERMQLPWVKGGWARRLVKEVPGTKGAPRAWYEKLREVCLRRDESDEYYMEQSRVESCVFWARDARTEEAVGAVGIHVDDGRGRMAEGARKWFRDRLEREFGEEKRAGLKWFEGEVSEDFVGVTWTHEEGCTVLDQCKYIENELREITIEAKRRRQEALTMYDKAEVSRVVGQLRWVSRTLPFWAVDIHACTRVQHDSEATVADLHKLNKLVRTIKCEAVKRENKWTLPVLTGRLEAVIASDAGDPPNTRDYDGRWSEGWIITLRDEEGSTSCLTWKASKAKRVAHGSYGGECVSGVSALEKFAVLKEFCDEMTGLRPTLFEQIARELAGESLDSEVESGLEGLFCLDSDSMVEAIYSLCMPEVAKPRKCDIGHFKEGLCQGVLKEVRFVPGGKNAADVLTKEKARTKGTQPLWWRLIRGQGWTEEV